MGIKSSWAGYCKTFCSVAFFGLTGYNRLKPHIRFGYGSVTVMISVWFGVGLASVWCRFRVFLRPVSIFLCLPVSISWAKGTFLVNRLQPVNRLTVYTVITGYNRSPRCNKAFCITQKGVLTPPAPRPLSVLVKNALWHSVKISLIRRTLLHRGNRL